MGVCRLWFDNAATTSQVTAMAIQPRREDEEIGDEMEDMTLVNVCLNQRGIGEANEHRLIDLCDVNLLS